MKILVGILIGIILFFFGSPLICFSQNEANVWCFGSHIQIDFNPSSPIVSNVASIEAFEGTSSICDSTGNLLFYTDGLSVWDRNHNLMPDGTGLLGGYSSTQAAIICKKPNSPTRYLIFTTGEMADTNGLKYTEIDMTLNSGFGNVVPGLKNIQLQNQCGEKVSITKHSNGNDLWVMTHDIYSNAFRTYLITASGVDTTAIISYTGMVHGYGFMGGGAAGQLKFSPNGDFVAISSQSFVLVQVFQFDKSTGSVYNPVTIDNGGGCYSLEFSPNSKILYSQAGGGDIYQYDLNVFDSISVNQSEFLINTSQDFTCLQLAKNGKIYALNFYASYTPHYLGVFSNPNQLGGGCGFTSTGLNIPYITETWSFPNFPPYYFDNSGATVVNEIEELKILHISPNPTNDKIYINFRSNKEGKVLFTLRNSIGKTLKKLEFEDCFLQTYELDISLLPPAIYLLEASADGVRTVEKIIKE